MLFCHHLKHLTLISGSKEDWDRDIKIFYLIVFGYAVALFIGRLLGEVSFKKDWLEIMKNIAYKEKIEEEKAEGEEKNGREDQFEGNVCYKILDKLLKVLSHFSSYGESPIDKYKDDSVRF